MRLMPMTPGHAYPRHLAAKTVRWMGIDILKSGKSNYPDIPVVIISGHGNIEIAVAAIKQGAFRFHRKPFNIDQLLRGYSPGYGSGQSCAAKTPLLRSQYQQPLELDWTKLRVFKTLKSSLDKVDKSNGRVLLNRAHPASARRRLRATVHIEF
jgi:two-component system nitrogen regulation response regulator NtrX